MAAIVRGMIAFARTGRLNSLAALVAVAVLLVHAVIMGWHVPPALRTLATLDGNICHDLAPSFAAFDGGSPDHESPDHPGLPVDHLAHCPICLSVDGGKLLGPAAGSIPGSPTRVARIVFTPPGALAAVTVGRFSFFARAPPTAV